MSDRGICTGRDARRVLCEKDESDFGWMNRKVQNKFVVEVPSGGKGVGVEGVTFDPQGRFGVLGGGT